MDSAWPLTVWAGSRRPKAVSCALLAMRDLERDAVRLCLQARGIHVRIPEAGEIINSDEVVVAVESPGFRWQRLCRRALKDGRVVVVGRDAEACLDGVVAGARGAVTLDSSSLAMAEAVGMVCDGNASLDQRVLLLMATFLANNNARPTSIYKPDPNGSEVSNELGIFIERSQNSATVVGANG